MTGSMMAVEMTPAMKAAALLGIAEHELRSAMAGDAFIRTGTEQAIEAYIKAVDRFVEVTDDAGYAAPGGDDG